MVEPKKNIKDLFRPKAVFEDRIGKVSRFDRNEKTTPFPEEHLRKICESIHPDEMIAYPQLEPFCDKLAQWLKVSREQVLVASGSDTAIRAIYEVYVEDGDEVVVLSPTYGMYVVYCKMFGAKAVEVNYNPDMSLPVERILAAINKNTKLVAIANPNHTGTVISEADLKKVVKAAQDHQALALIDEAYYHFYPQSVLKLINQFDNLIVVRTFSKAFGIAPLRVGYVVSNKEIIDQLYKVKLTHELTSFSVKTASYLLDNLEVMNDYLDEVNKGKQVLYRRLAKLGFEVLASEANFVFFKTSADLNNKLLMSELEKKKIYLKGPFTQVPFSGHIRVTTGTEEQMNMLCEEIEKIVSEQKRKEKA